MTNLINLITISRIILAPIILFFLLFDNYLICILLFLMAGVSDYFDGYLARKYRAESQLGEILDPIADKILIVFLLIGLSVVLNSYVIATLSAFIIAREIGVAALRDYCARNNISDRTKVTYLAKIKTSVQILTILIYLLGLLLDIMLLIVLADLLLIISTLITLYTGYEYTISSFKIK